VPWQALIADAFTAAPGFRPSISGLLERKAFMMRRFINLGGAASLVAVASAAAHAQGALQTVTLMKVDPQPLDTGYRSSKVVGTTVVNQANETVGNIDDPIAVADGQTSYTVRSVGGFMGLGTRYVVVPFTSLKDVDKKIVLPRGSKDALKAVPEFEYNS
jgi:hypothetical protein